MTPHHELHQHEAPTLELFAALGWRTAPGNSLDRDLADVVLEAPLRAALERLNPDLPRAAHQAALEEIRRDRRTMSLVAANRELYALMKNGVQVDYPDPETGHPERQTVRVIDWHDPKSNDFLLVSQLVVASETTPRRPDLVGFLNGLPLVLIELKASTRHPRAAYEENLEDYKSAIPEIFWHNAFILLSNGLDTRIGTLTAPFKQFTAWRKIKSEDEPRQTSLEIAVRATCAPERLLDLVENYTLFREAKGGHQKIVARYHQYLGVENALGALQERQARAAAGEDPSDGLGVYWHTQGSGKSFSMIFFAQKALRKFPGNFTFVIVTDRLDLDDQIYKNFARSGAVTENPEAVRADNAKHLARLLGEDHRYVFTLIHKFRPPEGQDQIDVLTQRHDVIVLTDEAHRSQYDVLAANMRRALPNAAFLAFTGTPLLAGEEKTRQIFGEYISVYNFKDSVEDGATVPLFYENRIPEVQLTNESLDEDMERLLEKAALDPEQEERIEREFGRQYHVLVRDDRLEKIAADIVEHFMGRGFLGKAMVVSIDKATAVKMFDKTQKYWSRKIERLRDEAERAPDDERQELEEKIDFMETTDMAVVVSHSADEAVKLRQKGVDIVPHRKRLEQEELDEAFKDAEHPLRIVFVCAKWMTGFDVPSCSTIYLDKPMRDHTLMQTIARANRTFEEDDRVGKDGVKRPGAEKENGLIVDYVGVFHNLQKALAVYGSGGGVAPGELPVRDKGELITELENALDEAEAFLGSLGIDLDAIEAAQVGDRTLLEEKAVDTLLSREEYKRQFRAHHSVVERLYKAVLPDVRATVLLPRRRRLGRLMEILRATVDLGDVYAVMREVGDLLDRSVAAEGYVIREPSPGRIDLSTLDLEALEERFKTGHKHIEIERLTAALKRELDDLVRRNPTRASFMARYERLIAAYNSGSHNTEAHFQELLAFTRDLDAEQQRAHRERLEEEELTIFDLLVQNGDLGLDEDEREAVKKVARELLENLKRGQFVLDWRKKQRAKAQVKLTIEKTLDGLPSPAYGRELYEKKCRRVYEHVYQAYYGGGTSLFDSAL